MTLDQTSAALGIKRYVHRTVNRDSRHRLSKLFEKYTVGVIVLLLEYQMTTWARSVRWEPHTGIELCRDTILHLSWPSQGTRRSLRPSDKSTVTEFHSGVRQGPLFRRLSQRRRAKM